MKNLILASAFALVGVVGLTAPSAQAANARHPYSNVDHRNDNGNNTGDDQVERLNAMQLDQARAGAAPMMGDHGNMPMMGSHDAMPMNGAMPMPGRPGAPPIR